MSSDAIAALLGTLLGGAISFGVTWFNLWRQRVNERKAVVLALNGEIATLVNLVEHREMLYHLSQMIKSIDNQLEQFKAGRQSQLYVPRLWFNVTQNLFSVFTANAGKVGLLDAVLLQEMMDFYVQAMIVLDDLKSYAMITNTGPVRPEDLEAERESFVETKNLLADLVGDRRRRIQEMSEKYVKLPPSVPAKVSSSIQKYDNRSPALFQKPNKTDPGLKGMTTK